MSPLDGSPPPPAAATVLSILVRSSAFKVRGQVSLSHLLPKSPQQLSAGAPLCPSAQLPCKTQQLQSLGVPREGKDTGGRAGGAQGALTGPHTVPRPQRSWNETRVQVASLRSFPRVPNPDLLCRWLKLDSDNPSPLAKRPPLLYPARRS